MQTEILKMSDEELKQEYVNSYLERFKSYEHQEKHSLIEKQFLKRLSKNNIEEFKNKIILTIKDYLSKYPFMQGKETVKDNIEYLINNTK